MNKYFELREIEGISTEWNENCKHFIKKYLFTTMDERAVSSLF